MEAPIIAEPTGQGSIPTKGKHPGHKAHAADWRSGGAETLAMLRSFLQGGGFGLFASAQLINQGLFGADFFAPRGRDQLAPHKSRSV